MLLGGGGARGGGGNTIIGGRDLSMFGSIDGVRDRLTTSSRTDDNVDSMDCRLSDCEVRGRAMNVAFASRMVVFGEGAATTVVDTVAEGTVVVAVGPADEGAMNWNCWELGPTRKTVGTDGAAAAAAAATTAAAAAEAVEDALEDVGPEVGIGIGTMAGVVAGVVAGTIAGGSGGIHSSV